MSDAPEPTPDAMPKAADPRRGWFILISTVAADLVLSTDHGPWPVPLRLSFIEFVKPGLAVSLIGVLWMVGRNRARPWRLTAAVITVAVLTLLIWLEQLGGPR